MFETRRGKLNHLNVVTLISLGWFLILGIRYVIPALLPEIVLEFSISNTMAGFAITALWLSYAIAQFPSGVLIDWFKERTVLLLSLLLTVLSLLLFGSSVTFAIFFMGCLLYGWGSGFYGTPRATVLSRTFPDNSGIAIGTVLAVGSVGAAVLPVGATFVANSIHWRVPFLLLVPALLVVCVGVAYVLPKERMKRDSSPSIRIDSSLVSALGSALVDRRIFPAAAAASLMTFTFQALTAFFPIYLVMTKSISPALAAALFGILFVSGAVVQPVSGVLADRIGYRRTLIAMSGGSILPFVALPFSETVAVITVLALLFGLQQGIVPVNNAYTVQSLPEELQGSAWGFIRTLMFAIGSLGSLFLGILFDMELYDEAILSLAIIAIVTMLLYRGLPKNDV